MENIYEFLGIDSNYILKNHIENRKPYYGISYKNLYLLANKIENKEEFIKNNDLSIYELEIIQTYLIGKIRDIELALYYFDKQLLLSKEWSVIDSLAQKFIIAKKHRTKVFSYLLEKSLINDEYIQRMISVMLLSHFLTDDYVDQSIDLINQLKNGGYYTKMSISWFYQALFVKYKNKCLSILKNKEIDSFIFKKAISKMIESKKISEQDKIYLKSLRSRNGD